MRVTKLLSRILNTFIPLGIWSAARCAAARRFAEGLRKFLCEAFKIFCKKHTEALRKRLPKRFSEKRSKLAVFHLGFEARLRKHFRSTSEAKKIWAFSHWKTSEGKRIFHLGFERFSLKRFRSASQAKKMMKKKKCEALRKESVISLRSASQRKRPSRSARHFKSLRGCNQAAG